MKKEIEADEYDYTDLGIAEAWERRQKAVGK